MDAAPARLSRGGGAGLSRAVAACAWALLFGAVALVLARPVIGYDSWWYHLPFSSFIWGIGGGAEGFRPDAISQQRWLGFPLLWQAVQGFFWYATGALRAIVVPQLLLCLAYFAYAAWALRIPPAWTVLGFFSCPMLVVHFQSTYLDLPAGLALALMFLALVPLVADAAERAPWSFWPRAACVVAMAAIAGNTKVQGLLACLVLSGIVLVACLVTPGIAARRRAAVAALLVAASLAAGATAFGNLARHGNPVYPIAVQAFGREVFAGPESPDMTADYPTHYALGGWREVSFPRPVNFVLSVTELDWVLRGVPPWYNLDSVNGLSPRLGPPSRTGGWGAVFVLLSLGLLFVQLLGFRRLADTRQRLLVATAAALLVATAFLPRSHELRYWLYLPLVLTPINLRFLWHGRDAAWPVGAMLLGLALHGTALAVLSPNSALLNTPRLTEAELRRRVPPHVTEALARTGRFCDAEDELLFRHAPAVTGLAGLVSRDPADCR